MRGGSQIANAVATWERCDVKKDSTAAGKDHSTNAMLPRSPAQERGTAQTSESRAPFVVK